MGSFSLLAVNLDHMLGDLEAENEMLAYIDETENEILDGVMDSLTLSK